MSRLTAGVHAGPSIREAPAGQARPIQVGGPATIGATLTLLFLLSPPSPRRSRSRATAIAAGYTMATALGAWVLLERQAGHRPWNTIWAEDGGVFYPGALLHPVASLMQPYAGYLQLVPRLIAGAVALLPLRAAAAGFAMAGALVASACAAFVCQASAGHIRTPALRWLLAAGVILLPSALTELSDNGVNTPWYLLFALFWAMLWRPRSGRGAALAAVVAFAAASSNALAIVFTPLVLARVIALPRAREQAASFGWAGGGRRAAADRGAPVGSAPPGRPHQCGSGFLPAQRAGDGGGRTALREHAGRAGRPGRGRADPGRRRHRGGWLGAGHRRATDPAVHSRCSRPGADAGAGCGGRPRLGGPRAGPDVGPR